MAKVYVFLADGFEEIEALAPVDILRRGGVEVVTVSIMPGDVVVGAHGVSVLSDVVFDNVASFDDADVLMLPGGMPGAKNLDEHKGLHRVLLRHYSAGRHIAAICAAPMVLGHLGLLQGHHATCYPGFEEHLLGATYTSEVVTADGLIITGKGAGAALAFGFTILSLLTSGDVVESLKEGMIYNQLFES